jgi:hypothetical protein
MQHGLSVVKLWEVVSTRASRVTGGRSIQARDACDMLRQKRLAPEIFDFARS